MAGPDLVSRAEGAPSYGFVIDNRRCIGCHACTVACKAEHGDPIGINKTWVSYIEKGIYPDVSRAFHVMRCNHCANAPCVEICPTACLETREDGIVDFDPGRCIGCKACMQACPYDAITIDLRGNATKCNYCAHRVDVGREPACVVVCPAEAIVVGNLDDSTSKIARIVAGEDVSVRKPEKGTRPKLYYVDGDAAALNPSGAAVSSRTLWGAKPADGLEAGPASPVAAAPRGAPRRTYDIAQRHVMSWGWKVAAYLFTKSIAAGAFLLPALLMFLAPASVVDACLTVGVPVALVALGVTGVLLVADLKRPERFLWVLLRPQWRSWLVRGAYVITAYGLLLTMWFLVSPSIEGEVTAGLRFWGVLGGLLAAGTAAYSGWLFGQAKGRDFWQSPVVPLHLLVQSIVAGAAVFVIAGPWIEGAEELASWLRWSLVAHVALVVSEVWGRHATADAAAAAALLRRGERGLALIGGSLFLGGALPIVLLLAGAGPFTSALAGVLSLAGLAVYEYLWVEAPQRLPLA